MTFAKFTHILFMTRFLLSLIIIVLCYFNLNLAYNKQLSLKIKNVSSKYTLSDRWEICNENESPLKGSFYSQHSDIEAKVLSIKLWTTLKLSGMILAYIIFILPNATISLFLALSPRYIDPSITTFSHIFNSFTGIINPLFVLLIHDSARKQVDKMLAKLNLKALPNASQSAFPYSP